MKKMKRKERSALAEYPGRVAALDRLVEFWLGKLEDADRYPSVREGLELAEKRRAVLARVLAARDRIMVEWTEAVLGDGPMVKGALAPPPPRKEQP